MSNTFTENQLIEAGLSFFKNDSLASDVWVKKYALKSNGTWEESHPSETVQRVINEFVRMENNFPNPLSKEKITYHLENFKHFIPGGSILFGLGNKNQISSLGNCFFIHNGADSYGGIFNIDESMVQLMKRRGGVGVTLENLRPGGSTVNNAAQTSTGSISFAHRYSESTREVAQDGRRGALMISCFSPDTFVYTDNGWEYITILIERWYKGEKPKAWTHEGFKEIEDVQEFSETEIYEITCENGKVIKVTGDHKFVVRNIDSNEEYLKELKNINVEKEEIVFFGVHDNDNII